MYSTEFTQIRIKFSKHLLHACTTYKYTSACNQTTAPTELKVLLCFYVFGVVTDKDYIFHHSLYSKDVRKPV